MLTLKKDIIKHMYDTMVYAEVTVCFDNTDPNYRFDVPYDEVTVTRRYYRGGTSEYLINNKPCLRKDVHELFMNTGVGREGYSIIGQGKIDNILSTKSEDRRQIFEEAAGISKYRYRKNEAERKLLRKAMERLGEREKVIINLRYGLSTPSGEEMTQKEVASYLGISQSYISRLEKKIMKRLKKEMMKVQC